MDAPIAIVMAAGKGTRMNSDLPKVLCKANGQPLVRYVLDALSALGERNAVNDELAGTPVLVVHEASSELAVPFDRRVGGEALTFEVVEAP